MLVAVSSAFATAPPDATDLAHLDALAEKLVASALLTQPTQDWIDRFGELLRRSPVDTQQRWAEFLKLRLAPLRNHASCVACRGQSSLGMVTAVADEATCKACGCERQAPTRLLANPELASALRQQVRGLATTDDCVQRLQGDFTLLCDAADRVDVIDPYAITDGLRALGSSGLERFLALADARGVAEVRLITGAAGAVNGSVLDSAALARGAATIGSAAGMLSTELHVCILNAHSARRYLHDRWVGFSWGTGGQVSFNLGKGFAQFNGSRPRQTHSLTRVRDGCVSQEASNLAPRAALVLRVL